MNQHIKDTILEMNERGRSRSPFLFLINFNLDDARIYDIDCLTDENIWVSFPNFSNKKDKAGKISFDFRKFPISYETYEKAYEHVMEGINRGDSFLINLTFPTRLDTKLMLDQIFQHGRARYRLKYKDEFVVFSPETFVQIRKNKILTFPMKGTIDASLPDAEKKLLTDLKEISEHNTIVDLLRNDLNMVSKKVKVDKFRYVEKIQTHERELLQTSSRISGELDPNWAGSLGDIIFKLLPAGSITGAPKRKTLEIIQEAEGYDRGWFTGICGVFDGQSVDSAVMIRFIENQLGNLVFKSGGGITHFSNCEQEFRELVEKVYLPF